MFNNQDEDEYSQRSYPWGSVNIENPVSILLKETIK